MALTDENMVMPVAPFGGGNGDGFGNGWWLIILFLICGFGNGFGGGFGGDGIYPWMNQADITTSGFNQAATQAGINGIQNAITSGFGDVQTALCGGFAGVNANISNGFAQNEIANNARQMANMQQAFDLQSQLANCCCENRLASADLKYTIATENCADRSAISDGIRDILVSNNANTQRILDMMCQDKIDAKNEKIADLERQLSMASLSASQIAQTAQLQAGNMAQTNYLVETIRPTPIPAYIVANPNTGTTTT